MPPGGDPAFLIFGSFDQAKERTRENKAARHNTNFSIGSSPSYLFFFLDEKEPTKSRTADRSSAHPFCPTHLGDDLVDRPCIWKKPYLNNKLTRRRFPPAVEMNKVATDKALTDTTPERQL